MLILFEASQPKKANVINGKSDRLMRSLIRNYYSTKNIVES